MYHLTGQSGASRGAAWEIHEGVTLLGRSRECGVQIPNDTAISRVHCEFRLQGARVYFRQLSERSVTLLNGKVVQEAELAPGDTLTVGLTTLLLGRDASLSAEPVAAFATRTLSEADAIYLGGGHSDSALSSKVNSLRDLAELFRFSNVFNQAESADGLMDALKGALDGRFSPEATWIARRSREGSVGLAMPLGVKGAGGEACPEVAQSLARAIEAGEGALIPVPAGAASGRGRSRMIAPLSAGGHAVGAVAIENGKFDRAYGEDDLQFFVALCRAAAPCLVSVEHIAALRAEVLRLRGGDAPADELLGESAMMGEVRRQLRLAAEASLNILILGESGTGKELASRSTHVYADFASGPYVVVNCAAIPADMLESELFGYKAGAFTGAAGARQGLIARANGGTLFLDEVGDLSLENQARVLRVIETGSYRPLGSDAERTSSFRVVSATNKDIPAMVESGAFRADLYHRLNGFEIKLPSLREHPDDIPDLAEHFFLQGMIRAKHPLKGLDPAAVECLVRAPWPGNARQLKNVIERGIALARGEYITAADLGLAEDDSAVKAGDGSMSLIEAEKRHIAHVFQRCKGDANESARQLGLSRSTFYNKLKKYGIELPASRG